MISWQILFMLICTALPASSLDCIVVLLQRSIHLEDAKVSEYQNSMQLVGLIWIWGDSQRRLQILALAARRGHPAVMAAVYVNLHRSIFAAPLTKLLNVSNLFALAMRPFVQPVPRCTSGCNKQYA